MGFYHVRGGLDTYLGGHQIDAIGICDNKIIVCECTTKQTSHREKIKGVIGSQNDIRRALGSDEKYKDTYNTYRKVMFLYWTNNSSVPEKLVSDFSNDDHNLRILGGSEIRAYETITKAIPTRAKYDFLTDIGLSMDKGESLSIEAFEYSFNNVRVYSFLIDPHELIKYTYVPRRKNNIGYQRMVVPDRISEINDYLKNGQNKDIIPTNLILSINKKEEFKKEREIAKNVNLGKLKLPLDYNSCLIIDGQHRLFAYEKGINKLMSVMAFSGINQNKQMKYFVDINYNAKPITKNLLWDLQGELNPNGEEGIISNIAKYLNTIPPFKDRIDIGGNVSSGISMTSLCASIQRMKLINENIKEGRLLTGKMMVENPDFSRTSELMVQNIGNSLAKYFEILFSGLAHNKEAVKYLESSGGISVAIYLYKIFLVLDATKTKRHIYTEYIPLLVKFLSIQPEHILTGFKRNTNEASKTEVLNIILNDMSQKEPTFNQFITTKITSLDDIVKSFEDYLTKYIVGELSTTSISYAHNLFPNKLKEIEHRQKGDTNTNSGFIYSLTLGEKIKVFENLLKTRTGKIGQRFIRDKTDKIDSNETRYLSLDDLLSDINRINNVRKRNSHNVQYSGEIITKVESDTAILNSNRFINLFTKQ